MIALVGGVIVTKRIGILGVDDMWSYPNIHGDVMATAASTGVKLAAFSYDPFGQPLGNVPDNATGSLRLRMAGPAPAGHRARPRHRHSRDGCSPVCPGYRALPGGRLGGGGSANDYANGDSRQRLGPERRGMSNRRRSARRVL